MNIVEYITEPSPVTWKHYKTQEPVGNPVDRALKKSRSIFESWSSFAIEIEDCRNKTNEALRSGNKREHEQKERKRIVHLSQCAVVYWCNNATICRRKKRGEKRKRGRSCRNDGLKRVTRTKERNEYEKGRRMVKKEIKRSF